MNMLYIDMVKTTGLRGKWDYGTIHFLKRSHMFKITTAIHLALHIEKYLSFLVEEGRKGCSSWVAVNNGKRLSEIRRKVVIADVLDVSHSSCGEVTGDV